MNTQNWGKDNEQKPGKEVRQKPGRQEKTQRIELGDPNPTNRNEETHKRLSTEQAHNKRTAQKNWNKAL